MNTSEIRLLESPDAVATAVATSAVELLAQLTKVQTEVNFVLTGGTVGILSLAKLAKIDSSDVDWSRVHIWWGDERYVAADSSDRNAQQARSAWLSAAGIVEENIHEFPDASFGALDDAAIAFDQVLAQRSPRFDLVLLGMGPDGHVASLFPGHDAKAPGGHTVAEHNSPKPPPQRLSFSYEMLNGADRIWFTVAGSDKAQAVADSIENPESKLPASKVSGKAETVWFIDSAAANAIRSIHRS